jgi:hypothetical protein
MLLLHTVDRDYDLSILFHFARLGKHGGRNINSPTNNNQSTPSQRHSLTASGETVATIGAAKTLIVK